MPDLILLLIGKKYPKWARMPTGKTLWGAAGQELAHQENKTHILTNIESEIKDCIGKATVHMKLFSIESLGDGNGNINANKSPVATQ